MPLPRKKTFLVFREAQKLGPYDERPMLPEDTHLQICLSRNDRPQPFFLCCEKDTLLAVFSGKGSVDFKETGALRFPFEAGDHVYVPGGAATRIVPDGECVILRYKAREAGIEAARFYCETCGEELYRHVFDTAKTPSQEGYLAGCTAFNNEDALRHCEGCGAEHPVIDLSPYRWQALADNLRS
ncbi:MAG: hypothetical protein R3B70_15095 [Polyangiaceae bacterium]